MECLLNYITARFNPIFLVEQIHVERSDLRGPGKEERFQGFSTDSRCNSLSRTSSSEFPQFIAVTKT